MITPALGTEKAITNRLLPFFFSSLRRAPSHSCSNASTVLIIVLVERRKVVCGAPAVRTRVGRRNAQVNYVHAQYATGVPVVACERCKELAWSAISTLYRTGAAVESVCSVEPECGGSSSSPSTSSPCFVLALSLGLFFVGSACVGVRERGC